jgi:hypothetical protein
MLFNAKTGSVGSHFSVMQKILGPSIRAKAGGSSCKLFLQSINKVFHNSRVGVAIGGIRSNLIEKEVTLVFNITDRNIK